MIKVVFHISDMNRWDINLNNIKNLLNELDSNKYNIEILANGESVNFYKKDLDKRVKELLLKDIKFLACNNSLNAFNIDRDSLNKEIEIVSAGVMYLIERQRDGFAYIKA